MVSDLKKAKQTRLLRDNESDTLFHMSNSKQNEKVFITGGSGMVGGNLIEHDDKDYEILCPTSAQLDLRDANAVTKYFKRHKPDFVIHTAAKVGGILANINDPIGYLDTNIVINRNVIMGAFNENIKNLINLGSSCMYPRFATNPLKENSILTGELEPTNEGYALAKVIALKMCQYIKKKNANLNYKTIIPCNLYGRFDNFMPEESHLLPAIIHKIHQAKIQNKQTVEIWGKGNARREFMYAGDLSGAIWRALLDIDILPSIFNCGLGYDHSINEYYKEVAVIGWSGSFVHNLDYPVGMSQKLSDVSLQQTWGWKPEITLKQGIQKTYSYYLEKVLQ